MPKVVLFVMIGFAVLVLFAVVVNIATDNKPDAKETSAANVEPPKAETVGIADAHPTPNIFTNVRLLRRAAVPIMSSVGWKDIGSGLGFYGSAEIRLPRTGIVPSTVSYSISGDAPHRVDEALISAFIASPRDISNGRVKVGALASQWFKSVGREAPSGLLTAIQTGKPFKGVNSDFSIQYLVERGTGSPITQPDGTGYQCTTMNLTINPR